MDKLMFAICLIGMLLPIALLFAAAGSKAIDDSIK